jgi:hypothetical protein
LRASFHSAAEGRGHGPAALQQGDGLPVTDDRDDKFPQPGVATVAQRLAVTPGFEEFRLVAHRAQLFPPRESVQRAAKRLRARLLVEDHGPLSVHGNECGIHAESPPDEIQEPTQSRQRDQFVKCVRHGSAYSIQIAAPVAKLQKYYGAIRSSFGVNGVARKRGKAGGSPNVQNPVSQKL